MSVRRLTPIVAACALAAVPLAGAAAEAPATPDQRFVAGLKDARQSLQVAFRQLTPWGISIDKVKRGRSELTKASDHLRKATEAAPDAVGATDDEIAASVASAAKLTGQAATQARKGNYEAARASINPALKATQTALVLFGAPLASEFKATTTYRELGNIQGWEEYLGLTARSTTPISKIVIGILGRPTANTGEPGAKRSPPSLSITKLAIYTLQEPSGAYSSGWGNIVNGIIVCELERTMKVSETFAVSFAPRVPKGTKFLVKFWSTDGRRSYSILTTK